MSITIPAHEEAAKWHLRFLEMARLIATWSKDPSTQTGCVVVDANRNIVSTGYNGFPRGVRDLSERYDDRPTKYRFVAHCDSNAVFSAANRGVSLRGATMYLTGPPCCECMKAIIQAGITVVVWPWDNPFEIDGSPTQERWADSMETSFTMACEAQVLMVRIK